MFRRSKHTFALALMLPLVAGVGLTAAGSSSAAVSRQQAYNGNFNAGRIGWVVSTPRTAVSIVPRGVGGGNALKVVNRSTGQVVLAGRQSGSAGSGLKYAVSAWVRTNQPGLRGRLVLKETRGSTASYSTKTFTAVGTWRKVSLTAVTKSASSTLQLRFGLNRLNKGRSALIDGLSIVRPVTGGVVVPEPTDTPTPTDPPPTTTPPPPTGDTMSNGCPITNRGIPGSCGAFLGSAYGGNADPTQWEATMNRHLGVRRTFYGATGVTKAVTTASADLAKGRLPWISFKLPHSWSEMAAGKGDAWTRDLATRLSKLDGPVWLAFHHEPETDGDIKQWTAMQAHLAPIVRATASNVAYSIILTGYHQYYGAAQYSLGSLWPKNTKIDLAGFDIYNQYGVVKDGVTNTKGTQMVPQYFSKLKTWSDSTGVPWGIAETGYTNKASEDDPLWVNRTYNELKQYGGKAFTYFNTNLNSIANWELSTQLKKDQFSAAIQNKPTL
jgi:hypothetical protein